MATSSDFGKGTLLSLLFIAGCSSSVERIDPERKTNLRSPMPLESTNHAVAQSVVKGETRFYTFMGLRQGKTWQDISRHAFEYAPESDQWHGLPPVPVAQGRLASVAASAGGQIYLFGGYTVAADGHEVSTPEVLRFDPVTRNYSAVAPMPTPVDDTVALVRGDRWIYLISGWHMDANVANVQLYDSQDNRWHAATAFPGTPVFGHAGALLQDTLLVCDGVRLEVVEGERTFSASSECWRGEIDATDLSRITWRRATQHPGPPRYRMGALADVERGWLVFAGGSENPYNYDGIGYDGHPAPASRRVQAYDPARDRWIELTSLPEASMDHRGMLQHAGRYFLLGGMRDRQQVTGQVLEHVVR